MNMDKRIPPIVCQPWCEANDGHTEADCIEEQCCYGVEQHVDLHLYAFVGYVGTGTAASSWRPEYLTVYPFKEFDRDPAVTIGKGDDAVADLTLPEARKLAAALLNCCDEIEGAL